MSGPTIPQQRACPVHSSSSPLGITGPLWPMHAPEFASDPHSVYRAMRECHGSLVSVEIAPGVVAVLVLDHDIARLILPDDDHYPVDPRGWQRTVAPDCSVLSLLGWRPDALRCDGAEHARYRGVVIDTLDDIDRFAVRRISEHRAKSLINGFCRDGSADLLHDFAVPLTVSVFDELLGLPPEVAGQAFTATIALHDTVDAAAAHRLLIDGRRNVGFAADIAPDCGTAIDRSEPTSPHGAGTVKA